MEVGRPIPNTAHLRDCSTGSIGYSYEVRPTFRLLPWAISPTHCTTRTQLKIIESIGQRRLRQYMPYCIRPRLRYYKRSYSFNPQSRFPDHSAESTGGLHRPNGILSRTSKTLTPWLAAPRPGIEPWTQTGWRGNIGEVKLLWCLCSGTYCSYMLVSLQNLI